MYRTTLYNLSEDLEHASTEFGQREIGEITAEEMHSLLQFLRHIDPVELHDAQPFVSVATPKGRFTIRATSGKLHLYDVTHPELGSCELEPEPLIQHISPSFERRSSEDASGNHIILPKKNSRLNTVIGVCMLGVGLLLNGYTLYATFYIDDVHRAPPLTLVTSPVEAQQLRDAITGYYATGTDAGDRAIVIKSDGSAELWLLGPKNRPRQRTNCTFNLGRREGKLYLALKPRGQIEIINQSSLKLYGDTYRRMP